MSPAALLYKSSSQPVPDGATLQSVAGYQVKLISEVPDADGMITVQGVPHRVRPEDVGLCVVPASVTMVLTGAEVGPVLAFYQSQPASESLPPNFPQAAPEPPPAESLLFRLRHGPSPR
jgi:hypothetical protein